MFRIKIQKSKIHPFSFDVFLLNDDIDPNKFLMTFRQSLTPHTHHVQRNTTI